MEQSEKAPLGVPRVFNANARRTHPEMGSVVGSRGQRAVLRAWCPQTLLGGQTHPAPPCLDQLILNNILSADYSTHNSVAVTCLVFLFYCKFYRRARDIGRGHVALPCVHVENELISRPQTFGDAANSTRTPPCTPLHAHQPSLCPRLRGAPKPESNPNRQPTIQPRYCRIPTLSATVSEIKSPQATPHMQWEPLRPTPPETPGT